VGTFVDKAETKHLIADLSDIYKLTAEIEARIKELCD